MSSRPNSQDCASPGMRLLARLAVVLLVSAVVFATQGHAAPIKYTLVITPSTDPSNTVVAGTLGTLAFGWPNSPVTLTFTFNGDTTNVVGFFALAPAGWTPPNASGYENMVGTGSVTIADAGTGAVLAQADFLPSAGIFISVDNTNAGIGFGSFAVANQNDPAFPGQPLYPFAMGPGGSYPVFFLINAYNLQTNFSASGVGISCVGFPFIVCDTPLVLPTTAGDLILYQTPNICCPPSGVFTAQVQSVTFSAFTPRAAISGTPPTSFQIYGSFTLGASSNGINPLSEPVTLQLGNFSFTIPAGSFVKTSTGRYVYQGTVGGEALRVGITPVTATTYNFKAVGWGTNLSGTANPVTVGLTIGDDTGTAAITAQFQSGDD